ncbi:phosphate/phosphite/phosphonate ABC transporter substrate-binding protein [Mesorhizobium sp. SP-1A]|uniref:phosphate/phosphite/phosphonate ABC transporter substrate-binding protein n=1 Tax=Mesorhizobium sp. SP-1A TaxID=3077840 RepID=UPI0028F6C314|nr:PhnD/SsuA/transferrin family substrate-binding protein [Mesorhizobium sp. SP-1A]
MSDRSRFLRRRLKTGIALALLAAAAWPFSARADWREDIGTFRVGILAEPGAGNTVAGLGRLTDAYSRALGMKVEFFVARDYGALVEAQLAGRIQYAVYSALAYAAARHRCGCVEPLVAPTDGDGAVGVRSVLIARQGRLAGPSDIASRKVALGPADSVTGSLLPLAELAGIASGGTPGGLSPNAADLLRASSASAAEAMLADGQADAIFGWQPAAREDGPDLPGGTVARLEAAGIAAADLKVVWRSRLLRYGPHAVLKSLDPETRRRLSVFLVNLKAQSPEIYDLLEGRHAGGFAAVSAQDYRLAEDLLVRIPDEAERQ